MELWGRTRIASADNCQTEKECEMPTNGKNETIGGGGFHHVAIRANNFDASLKFYIDGLGFKRKYGWGEPAGESGQKDTRAALLDSGDGNYIELFAGGMRPEGTTLPEEIFLHVAFRSNDVPKAMAQALANGATLYQDTKSVIPNNADEPKQTFTIGFVRGLDGELIEFFDNSVL